MDTKHVPRVPSERSDAERWKTALNSLRRAHLDFLRERRLEERTQDQLDDHEQRLRAIERPS